MRSRPVLVLAVATPVVATAVLLAAGTAGDLQTPPARPQQQSELELTISGEPGAPPRIAVPDFIALSPDEDTVALARTLGQVLWDDLAFEREFYLIPRDTYATIPQARSFTDVPLDRWRELGADGLLLGTVRKDGASVLVQVRLFSLKTRQSVFGKEYSGSASNPRLYAHTIADEVHQQQRGLRGVARTKLTFSSDRDGERMSGAFANRSLKEIYISDYDGANQRRVTVGRTLSIFPVWSADGRAIVYTSYRRGFPDLFVSYIYLGKLETPAKGTDRIHNWLASWSPDGTRIAFTSNRDGNAEIYVMNRDGSGLRRLTNHPSIDSSPTWSPAGNELAFTSDRSGTPQIYVVSADGLGAPRRITFESYADRPTWSPAPYNEIAYAARSGPGYDIRLYDVARGETRQVTFGEGSNESPAFAPNGRHVAFSSTRRGRSQIFIVGRDGRGLRQVTTAGNNYTPDWSRLCRVHDFVDTALGWCRWRIGDGNQRGTGAGRPASGSADEGDDRDRDREIGRMEPGWWVAPESCGGGARRRRTLDRRGVRQEDTADCAARAAAAGDDRDHRGPQAAGPSRARRRDAADCRAGAVRRGAIARREDARRAEQGVAPAARVLRLRQLRGQQRGAGRARGERGAAEAVSDVGHHGRGPLRRARDRRVQPGPGRAPGAVVAELPRVARHRGEPAADGELRQGVPVRSWTDRRGVRPEPPGAFRDHVEVSASGSRRASRGGRRTSRGRTCFTGTVSCATHGWRSS
jgi:TolB protein